MKRVLITAAAGSIGSRLRGTLRGKYLLRLSDVNPVSKLADGEEFVAADITDAGALLPLMEDVHGVGNVADDPVDVRRLSIWVSPRDLSQLIEIGLEHPGMRYEIVYGVSDNALSWWDNSGAARLGYVPADRSEDYAEKVLAQAPEPSPDSVAEHVQGGDFAVIEKGGGAPQRRA